MGTSHWAAPHTAPAGHGHVRGLRGRTPGDLPSSGTGVAEGAPAWWGVRREQAKGATFFSAVEGETVRPMLDVCWAPMLGAFSVLFEEFHDIKVRLRWGGHALARCAPAA